MSVILDASALIAMIKGGRDPPRSQPVSPVRE